MSFGMRMEMPATIDSALGSHELAHEQRGLLDLIDKLQFAQLDNVKLPQIVVVGDQSAGKSSVLEAITGTPFPRDAGACTRFATEIRLRRAAETRLTVSIIPDKNRPLRDQERLRQYGGTVDANMSFETLMRNAVDLIAPKGVPGRFAARDILVVDKRGPDMPLLTLVDLPGLVRNANNDQSIEDIRTIEALSDRYMKSSRTIILAVVGGNTDYVQAPILTKARHFDPSGSRTIGVLTKPDLTKDIGLEDKFIELVQNRDKENHFKLGWYVLLNPGPREPGQPWPSQEERRRREEEFFTRGKWSQLPAHMCGSAALKSKLSIQLQRHIGRYVKVLRRQIQAALDRCEAELKSLGTGKDTVEEMRIELVELFSESKELVIPAVYGFYKNPPRKNFFKVMADPNGIPAQNLRARAIEENDRFADRVRMNGRKQNFSSASDRRFSHVHGMSDNKADYSRSEVEMLLKQIRGTEFPGDAKPRAVYMLFQNYSENWGRLAQEHKDNLGVVCNEFLSEVIDFIWPERMREALRIHFLDPHMQGLMEKAQAELDRLTQDMHLEVQPYDPEYEERLRSWQGEATKDGATYTEAQEVLEKMLIYYELSAKSYIRNVITQVAERHLLQGIYSVFNSVEILNLPNDVVEAIAAENKETRDRRIALRKQKQAIEEARTICANLAMRKELRTVAGEDELNTDSDSDEESGNLRRQNTTASTAHYGAPAPAAYDNNPYAAHQRQGSSQRNAAPPTAAATTAPSSVASMPVREPRPYASRPAHAESPVATPTSVAWPDQHEYYGASKSSTSAVPPPVPPPRPTKEPPYAAPPVPQSSSSSSSRHAAAPENYYSPAAEPRTSGASSNGGLADAAAEYLARDRGARSSAKKLFGRA